MPYINLSPEAYQEETAELPSKVLNLWRRLAMTTSQADPFCCSPEWNLAYHATFYPNHNIFWHCNNDALLLLVEHPKNAAQILLTPMESGWFFGQPLLGGPAAVRLLDDTVQAFKKVYPATMLMFILSGIIENDFTTQYLYQLLSRRFAFFRYQSTTQCAASLTGGLDGWLERRSANHRSKLRKALKKINNHGISFERIATADQEHLANAYNRMLEVEARSWKGVKSCGMTESPSREFYASLISHLGENARIIFASQDGQDIGFIFGGITENVYRGQQFSYDSRFARLSLGNVMQYKKIEWLCEQGIARYDMGPITGPKMEYKEHWTEIHKEIQTWIMRPLF